MAAGVPEDARRAAAGGTEPGQKDAAAGVTVHVGSAIAPFGQVTATVLNPAPSSRQNNSGYFNASPGGISPSGAPLYVATITVAHLGDLDTIFELARTRGTERPVRVFLVGELAAQSLLT